MILSVAGVPVMMLWMYHKQAMFAFKWFGLLLLPLSLLTCIFWCWVKGGIVRDMQRAQKCAYEFNACGNYIFYDTCRTSFLNEHR